MEFLFSDAVLRKLWDKHRVGRFEVEEAFFRRESGFVDDDRDGHRTEPPTQWFVSTTDAGRRLKVMFLRIDGFVVVKSAYDASDAVAKIYRARALSLQQR